MFEGTLIEGIITIFGLCITFLPVLIYFNYLLTHVSKKTRFDYHLELVKDKKGTLGIGIAYAERILFGSTICSFGVLLSEFFQNNTVFLVFVILLVLYIIIKYLDEKNEK